MVAETRTRTRRRMDLTPEHNGELGDTVQKYKELYGDTVIRIASTRPPSKHLPTGIFSLDMSLCGGIPEGYVTLLYGRESSGKTTLGLRLMAQAQRKHPDKVAVMLDVEGTYDPTWGRVHGINNDTMLLVQPNGGEQALDIADSVTRAAETSIVVMDSLAALVPVKELEKSIEDPLVGTAGKMIASFSRKIQNALNEERKRDHQPTVLLINQWRQKIGVFRGDTRVLPGGSSQHYLAAVKLEILNKEVLGKDDMDFEVVGHNEHSFKIKKNKVVNSMRSGEFQMIVNPSHPLGPGFIDDGRTVATWAKRMGVITGGGGAFQIDGVEGTFRKLDDIVEHFYQDMEWYFGFQRRLITLHRVTKGLSADGWY